MHVKNADGGMPYEDAVLDFTNPETVQWYQQKILGLLKQGVSTIKCDFGEAAPYDGFYHNGRGGLYEHNLYPLRYNKTLWEAVEQQYPGEGIFFSIFFHLVNPGDGSKFDFGLARNPCVPPGRRLNVSERTVPIDTQTVLVNDPDSYAASSFISVFSADGLNPS